MVQRLTACRAPGCTNFSRARDLCSKHYARWRRGETISCDVPTEDRRRKVTPDIELRILADDRCAATVAAELGLYILTVYRIRRKHGRRYIRTKLTVDQVRAIRESPHKNESLAAEYGVNPGTILAIKHGRSWGWLK